MQRMVLVAALVAGLTVTGIMAFSKKDKQVAGNGFAVVELFTSEGCSSCPPADEALAALLTKYKSNVYVLGFHVDYWNSLGWKDVYSSHAFTERQGNYREALGLSTVYTPQAIVNGTTEFTGSDRGKLNATVDKGLSRGAPQELTLSAKSNSAKTISVSYNLKAPAQLLINIALVQLNAQSSVQRGENAGKVLRHVNVVRDFKTAKAGQQGQAVLTLPDGLDAKDCMVIAYLQDGASFKITSASSANIQ